MYDLNAIVCMDKVMRLVHGNVKADTNLRKLSQVTKDSMPLITKADWQQKVVIVNANAVILRHAVTVIKYV
jgi:hypothetical protein